jgi:DNA primase small subunit
MADNQAQNGASHHTADSDVTMAEADADMKTTPGATAHGSETKEVKLEDLFADVDSDEDFPSSRPDGVKPSSPPVAPSSPVYGFII